MTTIMYFCTIFLWLIEEIFSHVSTKFYCKILKTEKVMNFRRKILNFKLTKLTKREYFLFQIFIFYSNERSLQNGIMLENYQFCIPKPTNKTQLKIVLAAIWNDLAQEPIKKA